MLFESVPVDAVGEGPAGLPPRELLLSYATFASGGREPHCFRVTEEAGDTVGWMVQATPSDECLPGRMYGFVFDKSSHGLDLDRLYRSIRREFGGNWRVHLPPLESPMEYSASFKNKLSRYESHFTYLLRCTTEKEAWSRLKRVGRQGVEKSRRSGLEIRKGRNPAAVMQFLSLALHKSQRLKSPQMTREDFTRLEELFEDQLALHVGYLENRPVSAVLSVQSGEYAMFVDNASLTDSWSANPNNGVVWAAMVHHVAQGATTVDLGFSTREQEGAGRFKKHMGGTERVCFTVGAR